MSNEQPKFLRSRGVWLLSAILAGALFLPVPGRAQERVIPPDAMKPRPRVPIYDPGAPVLKKVLKNGVTVVVQEQRTSERVAGGITLRMGTLYESDDDAGRCQVLIKSITNATETKKPAELALQLLAAEATIESGAGPDLGWITISTKREGAERAVDLLSEVALRPAFPDTAVYASRQRALTAAGDQNEDPLRSSYSMFLAAMYKGSPLARPVAGTVQGLEGVSRRDIVELHKRYFVGGNMVVCFVGNFDGKKMMARLEKAFASAPSGKAVEPVPGDPVPLAADTTITADRDLLAPVMTFGYPAPGYLNPDYPAFKIIESYLAAPDRSPIALWMPQSGLAGSVGVLYAPYAKRSSMAVYLTTRPDKIGEARDTLAAVMGRLRAQPLEEGEWAEQLKRVQNATFALQDDPMVRVRVMSQYETEGLGYDFLKRFESNLLQLNAEAVRAAAARWFTHSVEAVIAPARGESNSKL